MVYREKRKGGSISFEWSARESGSRERESEWSNLTVTVG